MTVETWVGPSDSDTDGAALQQFGVLPWRTRRDGKMRILLITSRRRGRWIIPKGWPIEDQPPVIAASREAFEEAGVIGDIHPGPLTDYLYMKTLDDGSVEPCRVTVFGMRVHGTLSTWREQEQRQRRWFSVEEAADRLDDAELADFVRSRGKGRPDTMVQTERCPDGQ
ncbi:NUDIX hydrolase [Microbaculum marinisediminis]|uniref:NUDIX hydrolase n=1 Tax=Microbaculum marinisediminis TaxID=2931392 RepID=A0AAW5R7H7_9HYPH|nr:NUDIX hydrolase [Microbaculum sp. A6E488]MCT8974405.1 NUDIX hydrolase [Microbaculum sp. A6E488]